MLLIDSLCRLQLCALFIKTNALLKLKHKKRDVRLEHPFLNKALYFKIRQVVGQY